MRCVEFAQRWNEALDLRESPEDDAALQAHLESCPACRASHVGFELVCDILRSQPLPDLLQAEMPVPSFSADDFSLASGRDDLAERVLAELAVAPRWESRRPSAARFRGLGVRAGAAGVAAATLLALYLAGSHHNGVSQPAPVAINSPSPEQVEPAADIQPSATGVGTAPVLASALPSNLDEQPDFTAQPDLGAQPDFGGHALVHGIDAVAYGIDAMGTVARDTSQELATAVRRIPDVAIELAGDGRTDLQAASETLFNVSHSLRPVAASMTETWHIFKRALPAGEPRRG